MIKHTPETLCELLTCVIGRQHAFSLVALVADDKVNILTLLNLTAILLTLNSTKHVQQTFCILVHVVCAVCQPPVF